ncbi:hypothetical protein [Orrella sp. 11846]|uniref:hypothetical protein n=1 Tax=Orrella sp. 11846 TaxID=3409913 RepID=UPI003B5B8A56
MKNLIIGLIGLIVLGVSQPAFAVKVFCVLETYEARNKNKWFTEIFDTKKNLNTLETEFFKASL